MGRAEHHRTDWRELLHQSIPALNGTNWTTLTNVSLPTQPYIYVDYSSATNIQCLYRAVPE